MRVLAADPDLGAALEGERALLAGSNVEARELELEPGQWSEASSVLGRSSCGALIVSGFMLREVTIEGHTTADLSGPGDLIAATEESSLTSAGADLRWNALGPVRLAVLDDAFLSSCEPWPEVVSTLLRRSTQAAARTAIARAISELPGIERRLLACLWHLAYWWGRIVPDGAIVAIELSHERLGQMVGARRPTITSALGRLRAAGLVERDDRGWRLSVERRAAERHAQASAPRWPGAAHGPDQSRPRGSPPEIDELRRLLAEQHRLLAAAQHRHDRNLHRLRAESQRLREIARGRADRQARSAGGEERGDTDGG